LARAFELGDAVSVTAQLKSLGTQEGLRLSDLRANGRPVLDAIWAHTAPQPAERTARRTLFEAALRGGLNPWTPTSFFAKGLLAHTGSTDDNTWLWQTVVRDQSVEALLAPHVLLGGGGASWGQPAVQGNALHQAIELNRADALAAVLDRVANPALARQAQPTMAPIVPFLVTLAMRLRSQESFAATLAAALPLFTETEVTTGIRVPDGHVYQGLMAYAASRADAGVLTEALAARTADPVPGIARRPGVRAP
jgi:hypothetical protein